MTATNKAQRYSKQISALGRALKSAVKPGRGQFGAWTYPGAGDSDNLDLKGTNGKIIIEYAPFHGVNPDDNCKHIAAAQVLVNPVKQKDPVILKTWEATDSQHAKRAASCNKPSGPKPSCYQQNQDPDQGITTEYCVCDKTRTLPFLTISPTVVRTKSCEYTSLPPKDTKRDVAATASPHPANPITARAPVITASPMLAKRDLTITKNLGPPTTDMKHCQVCTRVVNNEDSCSSIKDCVIQTGAVTLEAGSSSVHVGTVTGTALYTGVSSALEKICPTPTKGGFTACKTDSASIGKVPYVEGGFLAKDGEIVVSVESSKYNDTKIRGALIKTAAAAAQKAAAGKNCYEAHYEIEELKRRWWDPSPLVYRLLGRDHPHPEPEKATWCNSVGFAGPHYYNPWWKLQSQPGATDYMDVHFEFHKGSGGDFDCEFLQGLVDAFAFVQPEFAVGDIGLGEAIKVLCDCASGEHCGLRRRELDNSTLIGM
ncbi:fungal specific transcription factor domain-containing protein [Apiospora arundinis]